MKRSPALSISSALLALASCAALSVAGCRRAESSGGKGIAGQVVQGLQRAVREGVRAVQSLQGPAAGGLAAGWKSAEGEQTVQGSQTTLTVSNVSGPIKITGWDEETLRLHYVKQARTDADLEAFVIEVRAEGDKVEVRPIYGVTSMGRFGPVELELSVPRHFTRLSLANVSGDIAVSGLDGVVDLSITNVSGATSFDFAGGSLHAGSTSGSIEGTARSLGTAGAELTSVSGSVELRVSANLEAKLDLHSVSGSVTCELPVTVSEKSRTKLRGTLGSGSVPLSVSTTSGSIKVRSE